MRPKGVICVSSPREFFGAVTRKRAVSGSSARRTVLRALAAIALFLCGSTLSFAAPCGVGTLQDYIDLGAAGCTVGDLKFYNFDYEPSASGDATELDAEDVNVNTDMLDNYGYGLMFAADWSVTGTGQELDATITYDVAVLNNKKVTVETLLLNGAMISCNGCSNPPGDGTVNATEDTNNASLETYLNKEAMSDLDSAYFAGVTSDSVETYIAVNTEGPFSNASAQSVSNLFTVPEPSTWAMMLIGFAGLGYAGWRRNARSRLGGMS